MKLGTEAYALSDRPSISAAVPGVGTFEMPILDQNAVAYQATVNQPIYTFGRITSGIRAASEGVRANEAECSKTQLDIKMNVAEIYVVTLRTKRLIEVVDSKVVSLEAHCTDVTAFFEKGLVPRNDLLAAQVAVANAHQEALQVHNMLEVSYAAYNRALGRSLESTVSLAEIQTQGLPPNVDNLTNRAMELRPELAAYSAQARALREQAAGVRARKLPQVGLTGGYVNLQNEFLEPNGVAGVMLGVEWTPLDCGRVSNQASALNEKSEATIRLCRDAQSMIALEVRQRWLDLQTAIHKIEAVGQATTQADENLRVARDRYQHQVGTNTEVLDAETLRLQAYVNFYTSSYEAVLAELRLRRAVGDL
jgi:outer membrane protein TolC